MATPTPARPRGSRPALRGLRQATHSRPRRRSAGRFHQAHHPAVAPRRLAANFAALSLAEVACRATSMTVALGLAHRLGPAGYGRVEFAFGLVTWLVLLVREGLDVIATREIARHPRLVRPLVNHVLALRGLIASLLFAGVVAAGALAYSEPADRRVLTLYGLMLLTTATGLDFVFRGTERVRLIAASLVVRTAVYAAGVALLVVDPAHVAWVPACLVAGEATGIAIVWARYVRLYGLPRPTLRSRRFLAALVQRGRTIYVIQVSQAVLASADLLVVGVLSGWADVGLYSAPHRLTAAVLTFGLILQQVVFPGLARSWRAAPDDGRRALDALVRVLATGLVPLCVGTALLSGPLVSATLPREYAGAALLLAIGIWRAPLLIVAHLYQAALIALNRESAGVRLPVIGALAAFPLVALMRAAFGLAGAPVAMATIGLALVAAGHARLAREGRAPAAHHHLARPLLASALMAGPCWLLARSGLGPAILGSAAVYLAALVALGGLRRDDLLAIARRA